MKPKPFFISFVVFIFIIQASLFSVATAATRIMPLGDSITQGYASGETNEDRQVSYRKALWDKLLSAGYDVDFVGNLSSGSMLLANSAHEGHPGWYAAGGPVGQNILPEVYDILVSKHPVDVVLLHIGTNDISSGHEDASEISDILDEIDQYEINNGIDVWVILARIINRSNHICPNSSDTTIFNNSVAAMAQARIDDPVNPDKIKIVDMECGADIDYREQPTGDMNDNVHPYQNPTTGEAPGFAKMADVWFDALEQILPPVADFTADPTSAPIPLTVSFTDESTGEITDFTWDFGDGSGSSTQQNPSYTYNDPGTYTVSLTATGPAGTDTETKTDYITVINSTDGDGGGGGGGGGCFISTATHGL